MTGKHGGNVGLPDQTNSPFRSHTLIDIPPPPVFKNSLVSKFIELNEIFMQEFIG